MVSTGVRNYFNRFFRYQILSVVCTRIKEEEMIFSPLTNDL